MGSGRRLGDEVGGAPELEDVGFEFWWEQESCEVWAAFHRELVLFAVGGPVSAGELVAACDHDVGVDRRGFEYVSFEVVSGWRPRADDGLW